MQTCTKGVNQMRRITTLGVELLNRIRRTTPLLGAILLAVVSGEYGRAFGADAPPVDLAMSFRPTQADVEYDIPDKASLKQCKVNVVREGKSSGWVVLGPAGQTLRKFMDSNGDNVVDQWSYYRNGLEVYRDIDSNFNSKVDQSRWLNLGGLRWGVDKNEDGRIDAWKMISPEEVSRIAVRALVTQDAAILAPLLATKEDLGTLGVDDALQKRILDAVAEPAAKLRKAAAGSKIINPKTAWMRFDGSAPSVIPADQLRTPGDVFVYENVMAIVETGAEPGLVQIGELVRIGDVWKMTSLPQPLEGKTVTVAQGALLDPANVAVADASVTAAVSPEMTKLVEQLQELDKSAPPPTASKAIIAKYTEQRTALLAEIRKQVTGDDDWAQWTRQMVDSITAAVQIGAYPAGIERLKALEGEVEKRLPDSSLAAALQYRLMVAEYSLAMSDADNEQKQKIQENWLKQLEAFASSRPKAEDTPDAALQLAVALEFNGKLDKAREWYDTLVTSYPEASATRRGRGAIKRIDLNGKPLVLKGPGLRGGTIDARQYEGKILLVIFWATWCKPCTEDLPQIKALYEKYRGDSKNPKFEIIGVNLDATPQTVAPYLAEWKVTWPQIYQPGALEGELALEYGIVSLPTMFIVDSDGKVFNRGASVTDLKEALAKAFDKEKPAETATPKTGKAAD